MKPTNTAQAEQPNTTATPTFDQLLENIDLTGQVELAILKSGLIVKQVTNFTVNGKVTKQYLSKPWETGKQFGLNFQTIGWQSSRRVVNGQVIDPTMGGKVAVPDYQFDFYIGDKTAEEVEKLQRLMSKMNFYEYLNSDGVSAFQHEDLLHFRNRERKQDATLDITKSVASFEELIGDNEKLD